MYALLSRQCFQRCQLYLPTCQTQNKKINSKIVKRMLRFVLKLGDFFHTGEGLYSSHFAFCTTWRLKHNGNANFCGLCISYFDSPILFTACRVHVPHPVSTQSTEEQFNTFVIRSSICNKNYPLQCLCICKHGICPLRHRKDLLIYVRGIKLLYFQLEYIKQLGHKTYCLDIF